MTITLPLQPQEEARLIAAAQAKGISPGDLVREALRPILDDPAIAANNSISGERAIWDVMLDNVSDVSGDEFAALPQDGASQLDHYLYGHPKRNQ